MGITYNQERSGYGVYMKFYDASAGTYTTRNNTTGDYFDNNAAVGDCLLIGIFNPGVAWRDIKFFVGTVLVAGSITVVWEYWSDGVWVALPGVVDNTNIFRNAGQKWVTFPVPVKMRHSSTRWYKGFGGNNCVWVRVRITGITNITEGGAQATQLIAIHDHFIKCTDEANLTATQIYNADVGGGWGVVTKDGTNFTVKANWELVNSVFTSKEEMISVGTSDCPAMIRNSSNASFTFGELDASGHGINGSAFFYHDLAYAWGGYIDFQNVNIYGSLYQRKYGTSKHSAKNMDVRDSSLTRASETYYIYGDFLRTSIAINALLYNYSDTTTLNNVILSDDCPTILFGGFFPKASDMDLSLEVRRCYSSQVSLIDCDVSDPLTQFTTYQTPATGKVYTYINYHLDLKVTDKDGTAISGATVLIKDKNGKIISYKDSGANSAETMLKDETDMNVTDGTKFSINDVIKVGGDKSEYMQVTNIVGNTLTVTRRYYGYSYPLSTYPTALDLYIVGETSTEASGSILQQLLTSYNTYWHKPGGVLTRVDEDRNPLIFQISKLGYQKYEKKFSLDKKTDWKIRLKRIPINVDTEVIL